MKTVLANVSNSFFIRNFMRTDASKILEKNGQVRLRLLCSRDKLDYYRSQFPESFLEFDILPEIKFSRTERFFKFLETASIHTRTSYMLSRSRLSRRGSKRFFVLKFFDFAISYGLWQFGRFKFWREAIRKFYFLIPNRTFDKILEKHKPDLVFLPSMIYSEDYVLAKAAKKRGIKTLGMTLSWDNFYSKTLLLVPPDKLMVHTGEIVEQAARLGDYPREKVAVTGIPQYDRYFKKERILSREEFFKKIGGDSSKKLILYAFSGKAGLDIEFEILDILYQALKKEEIKGRVEVLVRPYPRYDFPEGKLSELKKKYGFLALAAVSHPTGGKGDWEFDDQSLNFLVESLNHADIVITAYSTFFIEAAIFSKPLIGVSFDGYKNLDYWNSARRFFDWNHLAELKPLNGIRLVKNREEFITAINRYLEEPGHLQEGRDRIVLQQCQFTDGRSGERVAKTILEVLGLE